MAKVKLAQIAIARSGDKGDRSDLGLFAPAGPHIDEVYAVLEREVTAERVKALFGDFVLGEVTRYAAPNVHGLKFVMEQALGGGGPRSLRADNLGKALGGALLRLEVEVPDELLAKLGPRPAPPRDPYASAAWAVR
ncbi:MAG TPA: hypothetical protein VNU01_12525 [Egibacteraceae bacterium]|nr:hypothetical protein [Egibacteraceae bacterium]